TWSLCSSAQAKLSPSVIASIVEGKDTSCGVASLTSVPLPSWPSAFCPQQYSSSRSVTAQVWSWPPSTSTTPDSPTTRVASPLSVPATPSPSWPLSSSPQQATVPSLSTAHE